MHRLDAERNLNRRRRSSLSSASSWPDAMHCEACAAAGVLDTGVAAESEFPEGLKLATVRKPPVLFDRRNEGRAEGAAMTDRSRRWTSAQKAAAPFETAADPAGGRSRFLESRTCRLLVHSTFDARRCRERARIETRRGRRGIRRCSRWAFSADPVRQEDVAGVKAETAREVAVAYAEAARLATVERPRALSPEGASPCLKQRRNAVKGRRSRDPATAARGGPRASGRQGGHGVTLRRSARHGGRSGRRGGA